MGACYKWNGLAGYWKRICWLQKLLVKTGRSNQRDQEHKNLIPSKKSFKALKNTTEVGLCTWYLSMTYSDMNGSTISVQFSRWLPHHPAPEVHLQTSLLPFLHTHQQSWLPGCFLRLSLGSRLKGASELAVLRQQVLSTWRLESLTPLLWLSAHTVS